MPDSLCEGAALYRSQHTAMSLGSRPLTHPVSFPMHPACCCPDPIMLFLLLNFSLEMHRMLGKTQPPSSAPLGLPHSLQHQSTAGTLPARCKHGWLSPPHLHSAPGTETDPSPLSVHSLLANHLAILLHPIPPPPSPPSFSQHPSPPDSTWSMAPLPSGLQPASQDAVSSE